MIDIFLLMIFLNGTYVEVPYATKAECEEALASLSEAQPYQTEPPPVGECKHLLAASPTQEKP